MMIFGFLPKNLKTKAVAVAFSIAWPGVGHYDQHVDKLDNFQLLLVDKSAAGPEDFDIVFNPELTPWLRAVRVRSRSPAWRRERLYRGLEIHEAEPHGTGGIDVFFGACSSSMSERLAHVCCRGVAIVEAAGLLR
jgi:hypothetical protein